MKKANQQRGQRLIELMDEFCEFYEVQDTQKAVK